ncbi:MAG: alpha/beta hydrolase [Chloroflexota bacterium]
MFKRIIIAVLIIIVVGLALLLLIFYRPDLSREQLASTYVNDKSKFVKLPNGADVHYRDEGNPNGPVLLMLHGGFGSLHNWEGWVPHLRHDYRLVSLDLPAHGLTGQLPENVYTRATMIETADLLMQELGIESFSVAGNSMGGGLALHYALHHPEKIESLILIGSEGIPNGEGGYDTSLFSNQEPIRPGQPGYSDLSTTERLASKFIGPAVIRHTLDALIGDKSLLTNDFVDYFGRIIRYEGNREANLLMFRQWFDPETADPRDLETRLHEITVPVLYMHGAVDTVVPENVAQRFDELLPNSQLIVYEGVGHMAMIEKPAETAQDAILFFQANGIFE